ncbi:hypothetical protein [Streptomyces tunisiensis]|uniref:ABC transporter permease n=1 Tax=Streptomyces tunisiensis TaxID=948699 RepID=A0ABP7YCN4_9ACTN
MRGRVHEVRLPVLPVGTVALVFVLLLVFDRLTSWAEEARNRW